MDVLNYIKAAAAVAGCGFGFILGGFDGILLALLALVSADYCTGVLAAAWKKRLSSEVGFKGICKKVLIFLMVAMANFLDSYIFQGATPMRDAVIFFYIANEGISLLENVGGLGVPIPGFMREILLKLKEEEGGNHDRK
ncbi:MAG: phage holin family protein [Bacillota bacterium]|nr:phage holin family protein [Bacillota bacterium]